MIEGFVLACILGVTHAQGWSDPVVSIDVPVFNNTQRKDLIVTDGNHVHQIWSNYNDEPRIGYNIILPDGTKLLPDTMLSRDTSSGYPSCSFAPDGGFIGFWREYTPMWYTERDEDGSILIPPTLYTSEGWFTWPLIDSSPDSLGRLHMVFNLADGSVCYSVMEPGVGEVFRDTIPNSTMGCLVLVDGPRVHIKFNGSGDQLADYIQYDLDGNVTVPTVSLAEGFITNSNSSSMAVDYNGDVYVLVKGSPSGGPYRFSLYKVDCETGSLLINGKVIYMAVPGNTIIYPHLLPSPGGDYFYFIWVEDDPILRHKRWIRFAIIDTNGDFIEDPYVAYDYTDEDPQSIERLEATTNEDGDVFANWSWYYSGDDSYYIVLGWFDHNWLGIEEETASITPPEISLALSSNPFHDFLSIEVTGFSWLSELSVYDISGRKIRTLGPGEDNTFLWDGRDDDGNDLSVGTYVIRAESQGITTAAKVVKLD